MEFTESSIYEFIKANDVKFIRLGFCDVFGGQKNISVMPEMFLKAIDEGIPFDAAAVDGFLDMEKADLYLKPDLKTFSLVPWRSHSETVIRFLSDITKSDGSDFEGCSRNILKKVKRAAKDMGFSCNIGVNCEFYLFENDAAGYPTKTPIDDAGYFDISPLDKGEDIRRDICLTLEKMGIRPETSHHEQGPGQNEINFKYSDLLTTADNFMTFKWVVSTIAARSGASAVFDPKPLDNKNGNGMHIKLTLVKDGENIFKLKNGELGETAKHFIAGVMEKIPETTLFLNSVESSYDRLGRFTAPAHISWSYYNRSRLIRINAEKDFCHMELRSPDPVCNTYLAFALTLAAGLEGIENKLELCPPYDEKLSQQKAAKRLPSSLAEAVRLAENSQFLKRVIPEKVLSKYIEVKRETGDLVRESFLD
ncbi:MAG: glutamine synthetase family protein [Clostridiales bacterium]|jgi:glutamine synthetase|nr:glutamine synthetase family protein [Clostridiales bacterium]